MKQLELRYVAHVTTMTGILKEAYQTEATTIRDLLAELDDRYGGFRQTFVNPETGQMNLNAMIYYRGQGDIPVVVIDLDRPVADGGAITFW